MSGKEPDIHRRIVVEYGLKHVYTFITDGNGKILDEDVFTQPFRLERRDAAEEAEDCYRASWDWLNETVNITPPLQGTEDEEADSDEED